MIQSHFDRREFLKYSLDGRVAHGSPSFRGTRELGEALSHAPWRRYLQLSLRVHAYPGHFVLHMLRVKWRPASGRGLLRGLPREDLEQLLRTRMVSAKTWGGSY